MTSECACGVCVLLCLHQYPGSVLVLGAGQVLEYASPTELLANSSSVFYSMAKDAGLVSSKDAEPIPSEATPKDESVSSS